MTTLRLIAACLLLAPALAGAAAAPFGHDDPAFLNAYAAKMVRQGDYGSARIFLERAARLAPWNRTIRHNLAVLRAYQGGKAVPEMETARRDAPATPAQPRQRTGGPAARRPQGEKRAAAPAEATGALPPLWPARP